MDSSQQPNQQKILQSIQKNKGLIQEKRYYQYAQKIKLLSHRKMQTKKLKQAQILLLKGIQQLYKIPQADQQIALQLVQQLFELYQKNNSIITQQSIRKLLKSTINIRKTNQKYAQILYNLVKRIKIVRKIKQLTDFIVDFYTNQVSLLQKQVVIKFLNSWCADKQVKKQQIPAIWSRMVLMLGITRGFNIAKQLHAIRFQDYQQNPYFKFAIFLIKVAQIKSKQAFFILQQNYAPFLKSDNSFRQLTSTYGQIFLNVERKDKNQLQGLLSSFMQ